MRRLERTITAGVVALLGVATASAAPKSTLFDLDKELAAFFDLRASILPTEPGRNDTPEQHESKRQTRQALFEKHGIRDDDHWKKESQAGMSYSYSKRAQKIYGGKERILNMRRAAGQGMTVDEYLADREARVALLEKDRAKLELLHDQSVFDEAFLDPIEGVSLEQYAAASHLAVYYEGDFTAVTGQTGISEEKYQRVGELWQQRMRDDVTRLVMKQYGGHYMAAARGRFAAAGQNLGKAMLDDGPLQGPEPVTFEKWVEITEYYGAHAAEIKEPADVTRILEPYGLSFYEWNIASNWWGHKRTEAINAGDQGFLARWTELRHKYSVQFAPTRN